MATKAKTPESDNLSIWNAVCRTDPAHTKKVNQRGGFTAISAHYQVMSATAQFGPVGIGWGYVNGEPVFHDTLVIVPVTIWHGDRSNTFGPVYGSAEWKNSKGFIDSDAPKKAATDGLTKGLSHLGFNADVFLGRFDDSKYVDQMRREFAEEPANDGEEPAAREQLEGKHSCKTKLKAALKECHLKVSQAYSTRELDAIVKEYAADIKQGIRYLPKWISGDPEIGSIGLEAHVTNRRAVLGLVDSFRECSTKAALDNWFGANEGAVEALDDIQRKDFDRAYEEHEAGLQLVAAHQ